jgi:hypothetical protein
MRAPRSASARVVTPWLGSRVIDRVGAWTGALRLDVDLGLWLAYAGCGFTSGITSLDAQGCIRCTGRAHSVLGRAVEGYRLAVLRRPSTCAREWGPIFREVLGRQPHSARLQRIGFARTAEPGTATRCNPHPSAHDRYRYRQGTSARYCRSSFGSWPCADVAKLAAKTRPAKPIKIFLMEVDRSRWSLLRLVVPQPSGRVSPLPGGAFVMGRLSPQIDQEARGAVNPFVHAVTTPGNDR